nr:MAG TPA: hypothetical protein [Caudoviricetes sp.]
MWKNTGARAGACARSTTNQQWNVWVPLLDPVSSLHTIKTKKEEYGLMMNRSEENQNGCREQTRNEDEGIDGILEELMAHVCDELCRFREEMQGDLMDRICGRCGLQQYTDRIREEYEKINNFDKSQTGQLMNRYRKITLCKDCRYRAKGKSGYHYCRTGFGLPVVPLRENDGCSRGEER